jgi:hypothetical protein
MEAVAQEVAQGEPVSQIDPRLVADIERHDVLGSFDGLVSSVLLELSNRAGTSTSIAELVKATGGEYRRVAKAVHKIEDFLAQHPELVSFTLSSEHKETQACTLEPRDYESTEDALSAVNDVMDLRRKNLCLLFLTLVKSPTQAFSTAELQEAMLGITGTELSRPTISRSMRRLLKTIDDNSEFLPFEISKQKDGDRYLYQFSSSSEDFQMETAGRYLPFIIIQSPLFAKIYDLLLRNAGSPTDHEDIMALLGLDRKESTKIMDRFLNSLATNKFLPFTIARKWRGIKLLMLNFEGQAERSSTGVKRLSRRSDVVDVTDRTRRAVALGSNLDAVFAGEATSDYLLSSPPDTWKYLVANASWGIHLETPHPTIVDKLLERSSGGFAVSTDRLSIDVAVALNISFAEANKAIHNLERKMPRYALEFGFTVNVVDGYVSLLFIDTVQRRLAIEEKYGIENGNPSTVVHYFDCAKRVKGGTVKKRLGELDLPEEQMELLRFVSKGQAKNHFPTGREIVEGCRFASRHTARKALDELFDQRNRNRMYARSRTKSGIEVVTLA